MYVVMVSVAPRPGKPPTKIFQASLMKFCTEEAAEIHRAHLEAQDYGREIGKEYTYWVEPEAM